MNSQYFRMTSHKGQMHCVACGKMALINVCVLQLEYHMTFGEQDPSKRHTTYYNSIK